MTSTAPARGRWPLVSVIIPTHNYGHYVGEAIDSVLTQTYGHREVVVVDDGSTDDTSRVLQTYGDRIRVARLDGQGVSAARNAGLEMASGEFVVFLDADDLLLPDGLAAHVTHFERHPDIDVVHGKWYHCDVRRGTWWIGGNPHQTGDILRHVLLGNVAAIHAVMSRRRTIVEAGGFDPSVSYTADWEMWFRLAVRGHRFGFVQRPVAIYRVHGGSMARKLDRAAHDIFYVLDKHLSDPGTGRALQDLRATAYFTWHRYLAMARLSQSDAGGALPHLQEAVSLAPGALQSMDFTRRVVKAMWNAANRTGTVDADATADSAVRLLASLAGPEGPDGASRAAAHLGAALVLGLFGARRSGARHLTAAYRASWRATATIMGLRVLARLILPRSVAQAVLDGDAKMVHAARWPLPAMVEAVVNPPKAQGA